MSLSPIPGARPPAVTPFLAAFMAASPPPPRPAASTIASAAPTPRPTCWNNIVSAICYLPNLIMATIAKIVQFIGSFFTSRSPRSLASLPPLTAANTVQIRQTLTRVLNVGDAYNVITRRDAIDDLRNMGLHPLQILAHIYADPALSSAFAKIYVGSLQGEPTRTLLINALVARLGATSGIESYATSFATATTGSSDAESHIRTNNWTGLLAHLAGRINARDYIAADSTADHNIALAALLTDLSEGRAVNVAAMQARLTTAHPFRLLEDVYHLRGLSTHLATVLANHAQKNHFMDVIIPLFERAYTDRDLYRFAGLYASHSNLTRIAITDAITSHDWETVVEGAVNHALIAAPVAPPVPPAAPRPAAAPPAPPAPDIWGVLFQVVADELARPHPGARPVVAPAPRPAPRPDAAPAALRPVVAPAPALPAAEVTTTFAAMLTAAHGWFDPAMRIDRNGEEFYRFLLEHYYTTIDPRQKAALMAKMETLDDGQIRNLLARIAINSLLHRTTPLVATDLPLFLRPRRDELERLRLRTDRTPAEVDALVASLARGNADSNEAVKDACCTFVFDLMCESANKWSNPRVRLGGDGAAFYVNLLEIYYSTLNRTEQAVLRDKVAATDGDIILKLMPRLAIASLISMNTPVNGGAFPRFLRNPIAADRRRYYDVRSIINEVEALRIRNHLPGAATDAGIPAAIESLVGSLSQGNGESDTAIAAALEAFAAAHPAT